MYLWVPFPAFLPARGHLIGEIAPFPLQSEAARCRGGLWVLRVVLVIQLQISHSLLPSCLPGSGLALQPQIPIACLWGLNGSTPWGWCVGGHQAPFSLAGQWGPDGINRGWMMGVRTRAQDRYPPHPPLDRPAPIPTFLAKPSLWPGRPLSCP